MNNSTKSLLELLKDKSTIINAQTEQFQMEIKSIINNMIQSNVNNEEKSKYNNELNTLYADYSSSINRLEIEYLIKCEQHFKNKNIISTHNITTSSNNVEAPKSRPYKCHKCDISYTAKGSLTRHIRKNHLADSVESTESSDQSYTNSTNNSDELTNSNSDTIEFKCNICNKTFKNAAGLGSHARIHKNNSNESNTDDEDSTDEYDDTTNDNSTDEEDRPWKCKLCVKTFAQITYLRQHILKVHDGNPWECDACDESFKLKRDLKQHKLTNHTSINIPSLEAIEQKTTDRPFKCELCVANFAQVKYLRNHIRNIHNQNPWKCEDCKESFKLKRDLTAHKCSVHIDQNRINVDKSIENNDNGPSLYCVCRTPYEWPMIPCTYCPEWYHYKCVGLSDLTDQTCVDEYKCIECHKKDQ